MNWNYVKIEISKGSLYSTYFVSRTCPLSSQEIFKGALEDTYISSIQDYEILSDWEIIKVSLTEEEVEIASTSLDRYNFDNLVNTSSISDVMFQMYLDCVNN
jgi:hypothetical protein